MKNSSSGPRRQLPLYFYFCKAFAGSGEIGNEVSHPHYTWSREGGGQRITLFGSVYRSTADFPMKTYLIKLALHTCSFIFYFYNELQKLNCHEL